MDTTDAGAWLAPPAFAALGAEFARPVMPTPVPAPRLLAWNAALARDLDWPADPPAAAAAWFGGNALPPGAAPVATAYAGHQFGQFVPQLGDGRAVLLGDVRDAGGGLREVQLKGSGRTPFSRGGDGRAALGPVLREYLVSEAMHALGIPTTRALAVVLSGEQVWREGALPGAVLTRVAGSHLRVGSFQYAAARGDLAGLRGLLEFAIARHAPALHAHGRPALGLLEHVAGRSAERVVQWLHVGFVHGVMNTDNVAISGETLDYGPCAFLDEFHAGKTFSSIDRQGRYAYARQPAIAQWNLARLAECLLPLVDADEDRALAAVRAVVEAFPAQVQALWLAGARRKLGLARNEDGDDALANGFLEALQAVEADYTLSFRALAHRLDGRPWPQRLPDLPRTPAMEQWLEAWQARQAREPGDAAARAAAMRAVNPAVIPRNHRIEQAIVAALGGDLAPFDALLEAVRRPFDDDDGEREDLLPPTAGQRVLATFCGT